MTSPEDTPWRERASAEHRAFGLIGRFSNTVGAKGAALLERFFPRGNRYGESQDWVTEADWARIQQDPLRATILLYLAAFAVFALLVWAYFAQLDEVTRGEGKVIPSQQLKVVQSVDGGTVKAILVSEGDQVEKGDVLLALDRTRFLSKFQEQRAQIMALRAEVVRLRALVNDLVLTFPEDLKEKAPEIVDTERKLYVSSLSELTEKRNIHEEQLTQKEEDLNEAQAAREQYSSILSLARQELKATRPLLASGAVSEMDIIQLEREIANAKGELKRAKAAISRNKAAIRESESRLKEVELKMKNRWAGQLTESAARLESLSEAQAGLADRVQKTEIKAPTDGVIQKLHTNTEGGVVSPGRDIVEIVPSSDKLIIEAKILPKDIAFIRPGQSATVKLTAYDFNIFGGLKAEVKHISADTVTDDEDKTYYVVRLETQAQGFSKDLPIKTGMTAQVDILTGQKTVLEYLLKPVLRATSQAMTER
ncbi:HlyD family type I secretion periplasmic adaptor subunit [Salicola sp. Rm-C-2C1-2]|uniref:HlyD family type I secretion periplasmic adaptor subunit n=1 Tax=Salicola sp. Rm-C-2C1-2 TaxID=3141321 RepID=UPI0032E40AAA